MRFLLSLLLIINFCDINAQNLTLDEIISLRKKDIASVEEYLTTKGWEMVSTKEGDIENLSTIDFAFNKSYYEDKAESFFTYFYSEYTGRSRVNIQIHKSEKYNLLLARIKALGCKLIHSQILDTGIKKVYQGATSTFIINVNTNKEDYNNTKTVYHIFIIDNDDYQNNFLGR
jgi:hypothetical protein